MFYHLYCHEKYFQNPKCHVFKLFSKLLAVVAVCNIDSQSGMHAEQLEHDSGIWHVGLFALFNDFGWHPDKFINVIFRAYFFSFPALSQHISHFHGCVLGFFSPSHFKQEGKSKIHTHIHTHPSGSPLIWKFYGKGTSIFK